MHSLDIDLTEDADTKPTPIHLGFKTGANYLKAFLKGLENHGVNHVIINLKFSSRPAEEVIEHLGQEVVPSFS